MRHGALLARCVKPPGGACATKIICAPHRCLLRAFALRLPTSAHRRLSQSTSRPVNLDLPRHNAHDFEKVTKDGSVTENRQSAGLGVQNQSNPEKPMRDVNWVFENTGDRIETINGKSLQAVDEYVSHQSGTKLLCSWNLRSGDDRSIWVPGDAPRVRDLKLPVDLKPEANQDFPNSDWALGNPHVSFEPFFASLAAMNPLANFDKTDVIARSSTMCLLLGVVRGTIAQLGASNIAVAFHIALVNNTLIINRIQNPAKAHTLGRGSTPTMTGSFTKRITEMKTTEENINPDHSQAVRYDLAHLRCVVITPVDAATGDASLPPLIAPDQPLGVSQAAESVKVKRGGRGVPPGSVTKIMTGVMSAGSNDRRLNNKGQLKIKPSGLTKIWFERPKAILQGHFEPVTSSASGDTSRLARISIREVEPLLNQTEDACQLELQRLVTLLERLRNTARRFGGSCILTCLPSQASTSGGAKLPARFDLYECGSRPQPIVLDWHVERFWSKK